jgi:hypothetical protein
MLIGIYFLHLLTVTTHRRQGKKVSILPPGDVNPRPVPSRWGLLEDSPYRAVNTYYKEVLGEKMNKKLGSSNIYLTEEQYNQVNVSMSFYIQCSLLVFTWHTDSSLFRWLFCGSKTTSRFMKNSASFDLLLNLSSNLRRRDKIMETIRSIDMALMGISRRGSAW